jgi:TonB family protein
MHNSRNLASSVLVFSLLFLVISAILSSVRAQQPKPPDATSRAIQLYQQGDVAEAVKILKEIVKQRPDDADAWYYLGLAFNSQGLIREARPRFERLIQLRPDSADAHAKLAYALILANEPQKAIAMAQRATELGDHSPEAHYAIAEANFRLNSWERAVEEAEAALNVSPDFLPALITNSLAHLNLKQYSEAATSLEKFLASSPEDVDADTWRGQLKEMQESAAQSTITTKPTIETTILSGKVVTQKARVLSKPEPQYTEAARRAGVEGTVVLRAVFSSDGEVKHIVVTRALGSGLTTAAVRAAHQIRFQPAIKDERPVSMYIQLEYNFNLY